MDGRRFDEMTRVLAAGASRRRVLAGLAAGALGVLTGGRARAQEDASACAAVLCLEGTQCCNVCGEGQCVPIGEPCPEEQCGGEPCNAVVCGAGEFCCNESCSICAPIGGACTQQFCGGSCAAPGQPCDAAPEGCCTDLICGEDGLCAAGVVGPPPTTCGSDADCAAGITDPCTVATCDAGTCLVAIVDCAPGFVCCGNGECCPEEVCGAEGTACGAGLASCCAGTTCADGICAAGEPEPVCLAEGAVCEPTEDRCCRGTNCRTNDQGSSVCVARRNRETPIPAPAPAPAPAPTAPATTGSVVKTNDPAAPASGPVGAVVSRLPSTGAGDRASTAGGGLAAPLALLGGGAALVARLRRRGAVSGPREG